MKDDFHVLLVAPLGGVDVVERQRFLGEAGSGAWALVFPGGNVGEVVDHYLQKNMTSNLESSWENEFEAPGDERVRLRSVRVLPQMNDDECITVHTSLQIEFTYWNHMPSAVLNVTMFLYNLEEVCVFVTVSDFGPRPMGVIRHIVTIPGDFLNVGSYYVNVMIVKDTTVPLLVQKSVVSFDVTEGQAIGNWYGGIPGAVRPRLEWKSDAIG